MTADVALQACVILAAVGVSISSLELLARPALLADDALASWPVWRTSRSWLVAGPVSVVAGRLLEYPGVLRLVGLRLACALVAASPVDALQAPAAAIVAATTLLLVIRSPFGTDGADQMLFITFVCVPIAALIGTQTATELVLWFITGQACLSYLTAGAAKLGSATWRSGAALPGIFATDMYGTAWVGDLLDRHRHFARALGWSVIVLECSFPLVLIGNEPLTVGLLIAAGSFHLGAALFMRLNTFLWAFVATYPAIVFTVLA